MRNRFTNAGRDGPLGRPQTPQSDIPACARQKWSFKGIAQRTSPKIPRALPHHPGAQQKIRDGVRRHRVTEAVLPQDQPMIRKPAQDSRQPLIVAESKNARGHDE
jgi:hypothetical protein